MSLFHEALEAVSLGVRLLAVVVVVEPHLRLDLLRERAEFVVVGVDAGLELGRLTVMEDDVGHLVEVHDLVRAELRVRRDEHRLSC